MLSTAPAATAMSSNLVSVGTGAAACSPQLHQRPLSSPLGAPALDGDHYHPSRITTTNTCCLSSTPTRQASLGAYHDDRQTDLSPLNEYHSGYGYVESQTDPRALSISPSRTANPLRPTSFTSFLPASIRARLQSPRLEQHQEDPPAEEDPERYDMGLTGEGRKTRREWAESPGNTNLSQPQPAVSEGCPSPETTPKRQRVSTTATGPADNAPTSAGPTTQPSRLSLLTMFSRNNGPQLMTPEMHDELLNLKVEEALFPAGSPVGKDTFSPAAFKNLQTQATGLITKMQNAYRQKAQALTDVEMEREADREELEEAETRAKHLKFQLEDMAHKAAEQERRMQQLMEELASERRARSELERSTAVFVNSKQQQRNSLSPGGLYSEAGSTISEDLGVDDAERQKRTWRKSNGTDTSFETDDDSISFAESESVFSRPRSPSVSTTTTTRGVETSSVIDMPIPTPQSMRGPSSNKRTSVQSVMSNATNRRSQMSTFQKLMKGISGEGSDGCRNCKGQDASAAWDTVSLLRDENKSLKGRVSELEDCLEGALDAVNGIGL